MTSVSFLIGKMGTIIVRVFTLLWGLNELMVSFRIVSWHIVSDTYQVLTLTSRWLSSVKSSHPSSGFGALLAALVCAVIPRN